METPNSSYTIITIEFNGKYWEGGNFDAATARIVYDRARKNPDVYKAELLRFTPGQGWKLVASASKPISPEWYEKRGIDVDHHL